MEEVAEKELAGVNLCQEDSCSHLIAKPLTLQQYKPVMSGIVP